MKVPFVKKKDDTGKSIMVCLDDPDFCYVLHCPEWIKIEVDRGGF